MSLHTKDISKYNPQRKTCDEIRDDFSKLKGMGYVDKAKAVRRLTYDVRTSYEPDTYTPDELIFFINVLNTTKLDSRLQNKILLEWMKLTGHAEPKNLFKKNGKILVDGGAISVFDIENSKNISDILKYDSYDKTLSEVMNAGYLYLFGTGGDGVFNVQLRVVDGCEPMLSAKEMKCISSISQPYYLSAPSGTIVIGDSSQFHFPKDGFTNNLEPGYYKVKVFHFVIYGKVESYYIVLCKTEVPEPNNFDQPDYLE